MKKLFTILTFVAIVAFANAQNKVTDNVPAAPNTIAEEQKIKFVEETHDFGDINEGPKIEFDFIFTNTGNKPIEVTNAKASCGCTTPFYTKEPVMASNTGSIKVQYNTANRPGVFNKVVTVTYKYDGVEYQKLVYIKGKVIAAPKEDAVPVNDKTIIDTEE